MARGEVRNTSDADGLYDIKWNDGSDFNIYSDSLGGQLKALIDIRDGCNGEIESYAKNDDGTYTDMSSDADFLKSAVAGGLEVKVSAVIRASDKAYATTISRDI